MLLELRIVSRKTPRDGRLEITPETFRRLGIVPPPLRLRLGETAAEATLSTMTCTCGTTGSTREHQHQFLGCHLLRTLAADETVALSLMPDGTIEVARPHPLHPASQDASSP